MEAVRNRDKSVTPWFWFAATRTNHQTSDKSIVKIKARSKSEAAVECLVIGRRYSDKRAGKRVTLKLTTGIGVEKKADAK